MGKSLVPRKSGLTLAGKVGVGLLVCWAAVQVLPLVIGASFLVAVFGAAAVGIMFSVLSGLLSLAIYLGLPIFIILILVSMFSSDD